MEALAENVEVVNEDKEQESSSHNEKTMWDYLETDNGNSIASQVLNLFGEIKSSTLGANSSEKQSQLNAELSLKKFNSVVQLIVFCCGLFVVAALTYFDKFESGIAVMVGTLVGYFFGKGKS